MNSEKVDGNPASPSGESEALKADRARKAYLANLRHELRTPVNAILGYSEMLLEDAEKAGRGAWIPDLEKIQAAGRRLLARINEILDGAKIEGGKIDVTSQAFAAQVKYELRTPLNAVIGYCEMLLEGEGGDGPEEILSDLRKIREAGLRLFEFLDAIIHLSKIEAGRTDPVLDAERTAMVRDLVATIRPLQEDPGVISGNGRGLLLVVDDNEMNRDMLCRLLKRQGYQVMTAENGRQALELIARENFDLILLDVMMPEMNGYQVLEVIKTDPHLRPIPVIMISALNEMDSVARCIALGAADYLFKPFDPVLLRARMIASLADKRRHDTEQAYVKQIKRLLCREEEQHLTRLIGKTKQFQIIEKKIAELSQSDQPLMIIGPDGTATEDVARLIHLKSHRHENPFFIVDVAGGNEWKSYYARVRSLSKDKDKEVEKQLFENFQISTLFGHIPGAMPEADAGRLGYLDLAQGGTIVLQNIDRLSPGTRERLLFYLLEKKFYPLGADEGRTVDTRVMATLSGPAAEGEGRKFLRGKIPEGFWEKTIDLPTLASRRRDIPVIAESLLEKHTALTGKDIKGISPDAINILVRYSWPGNDRELENVIERGVLVCDGEMLLAEHIFLGLTPYAERGRLNLLRFEPFKKIFQNLKLRTSLRAVTFMGMMGVVLVTFLGGPDPRNNLGMGLVWYYWWPFLLLSLLVFGRFYCSICPICGLFEVSRRLGSLNRSAPRVFNHLGFALAGVLALGLFWSEYFFQVKEIPARTTLLLGGIALAAVAVNFVFQSEVWCRYICPLGSLIGVFSCLASVELRANNNVCSSQCRSTPCFKGDGKRTGCPMKLFPVSLMSNQLCKMCGTCVHHCPYHSIHLDLRWPGAEIWENKEPDRIASLSILAFLGILFPLFLHEKLLSLAGGQFYFTVIYCLSPLGAIAVFMAASWTERSPNHQKQIRFYGFAYLPLAFSGHAALLWPYLVHGVSWLRGSPFSGGFSPEATSVWPQRLILAVGVLWSGWALKKLSASRPFIVSLAHGTLVLSLGLGLLLVIGR